VTDIEVPPAVAAKARTSGTGEWLMALPDLVADLARAWGLAVGRSYADATEAWVAEARLADGREAVLEICVPRRGGARREATVLRLAGGRGCAALLADDGPREAMLLERLGPSLADLARPAPERHRILASLAAELWRPGAVIDPVDRAVLPRGAEKAGWLIERVLDGWEELGRPCSRPAVDHAVACARRR
jgi:streptomycin 6-kinase